MLVVQLHTLFFCNRHFFNNFQVGEGLNIFWLTRKRNKQKIINFKFLIILADREANFSLKKKFIKFLRHRIVSVQFSIKKSSSNFSHFSKITCLTQQNLNYIRILSKKKKSLLKSAYRRFPRSHCSIRTFSNYIRANPLKKFLEAKAPKPRLFVSIHVNVFFFQQSSSSHKRILSRKYHHSIQHIFIYFYNINTAHLFQNLTLGDIDKFSNQIVIKFLVYQSKNFTKKYCKKKYILINYQPLAKQCDFL